MRYSLLMHYPEMTEADLGEDVMAEGKAAFDAYAKSLDAAGVLVSAEVLQPVATATTLTLREGDAEDPGWPVRGHEGAARRHLRHRRAGPGCRARLGAEVSGRPVRRRRNPPVGRLLP